MRTVTVSPYDPHWAIKYAEEAEKIKVILGDELLTIHHIGSTSVPGLSAKPIIDILVEVRQIEAIDSFNPAFIHLGYEPRGEFGIPGRRFFRKGGDEHRSHHVHIFQTVDPNIIEHLAFCAFLRCHPEDATAYGNLKKSLALQYPNDIEQYMDGKDSLIKEIRARALAWFKNVP